MKMLKFCNLILVVTLISIPLHYENFGGSSYIICEKYRVKFTDGGIRVHKRMFRLADGRGSRLVA